MRGVCTVLVLALTVSAQPPLVLQATVRGPAAWRSILGPTDLGSMLATAAAEAKWRGYADGAERALRSARGDDAAFRAERERLLEYAGNLHVLAWLEQAEDAVHLVRWSAALIAEPDDHTDLQALASECTAWLERAGAAAATRWLALELAPPQVHDGRLISVLASREDLAAATARAEQFVCRALDAAAVLRAEFELQAALGLLRDRAGERDLVAAMLGVATQRATVSIGAAGPRVACEFGVAFGPGDGGVVRALLPAGGGRIDLAGLVPEDTATWYAWPVALPELWRALVDVGAAALEREPKRLRALLDQRLGGDPGTSVVARLDPHVLLAWRRAHGAPGAARPFTDACFACRTRDEPALIEAVGKALDGLAEAHRIDADGVLCCDAAGWALRIGFGVAAVAFGDAAPAHCDAVLERAAQRPPVQRPGAPPVGAPPGFYGEGRVEVTTLFARDLYGQLGRLVLAFGGVERLPDLIEVQREAQRWLPLLEQHRLATATALGGGTPAGWTLRILW